MASPNPWYKQYWKSFTRNAYSPPTCEGDKLEESKKNLLDQLLGEGSDPRVIEALGKVRRELFVPETSFDLAYENIPLPIGEGQTISQPLIIAIMLSALELRRTDKVLEVGTGSGYQAAVLAEMVNRVVTVERVQSLADSARERLKSLGYANIEVHLAKDALGWPEEAPYDAIIVAAGAPKLPPDLMNQLAIRGRLIIPVGSRENQELMKVTRTSDGFSVQTLGGCRFVPLIGKEAWLEDEIPDVSQ